MTFFSYEFYQNNAFMAIFIRILGMKMVQKHPTTILIIRVRAFRREVILPQRLDFILPYWKSNRSLNLKFIDIQPYRRLGYYLGYLFAFLAVIPEIIFKEFDFLFLENPYLTFFSPFAWFRRKKVLAEFVDYYPANLQRLYLQRSFRYFMAILICRFFHHFVRFITLESITAQQTLIRLHIPKNKIYIVPVGIDTSSMFYDEDLRKKMRNKLNFSNNAIVIGYLGKIVDYYHLDLIPRSISTLLASSPALKTRLSLLIIGDGPYLNKLKELCANLGLTRVVFVGPVPHTEIHGYYAAMDLFFFPLNALAIKIGELLAMGIPILVPRGMAEDWITHDSTGIVATQSTPSAFKEALLHYLEMDQEKKHTISQNATTFANNYLQVKKVANRYLEIIRIQLEKQ